MILLFFLGRRFFLFFLFWGGGWGGGVRWWGGRLSFNFKIVYALVFVEPYSNVVLKTSNEILCDWS